MLKEDTNRLDKIEKDISYLKHMVTYVLAWQTAIEATLNAIPMDMDIKHKEINGIAIQSMESQIKAMEEALNKLRAAYALM